MFSDDGNANSWSFRRQASPTEFGCPGGACPGTPSPAYAGQYFTGFRTDPAIAAVTDPAWSNGDKRVVGVMIPKTDVSVGDVVALLSEDGGQSWGNLQWVDVGVDGHSADEPWIASNHESPYQTYVSWVSKRPAPDNTPEAHIRSLQYGVSPPTFSGGQVRTVPPFPGDQNEGPQTAGHYYRFGFVTNLPTPCTNGTAGVVVVWQDGGGGRCDHAGPPHQDQGDIHWRIALYEPANGPNGTWFGPWTIESATTAHLDACVGEPLSKAYTARGGAQVAVDPTTRDVWVVHPTQSAVDARVRTAVEHGQIQCSGDPQRPVLVDFSTLWTSPNPGGGDDPPCPNCFDNDTWQPSIAMQRAGSPPVQRVAWYWYSTNDAANRQAALYTAYQENLAAVQGPFRITKSAYPMSTGATSWFVNAGTSPAYFLDPWDYQTLGSSWENGSFLSLWASDPRGANVPAWNGGFETGPGNWGNGAPCVGCTDWIPSGSTASIVNGVSHSGNSSALLGSTNPTGDSQIQQTFKPPAGATRVSFWYKMNCPDTVTYDWLIAKLTDNQTLQTVTILSPTCVTSPNFLLSPTANVLADGRTYTLTITNHDDLWPTDPSYTYVDDVTFSGAATLGDVHIVSNLLK